MPGNFQIAYVIELIDKYSKVAAQLNQHIQKIDKNILGASKNFKKFEKAASESMDKAKRGTRQAREGMERFTRDTRKQTMAMRGMSAVVGNLKFRLASLLVTMGMTGMGMKQFVDKMKPMDKAFKITEALTGIVGKDFEFLEKKAFQFSRVMGVPMEDVMTGFKRVAGLKPELLKNVPALAELTKWTLILDAPMEQIEKVSRALTVALNVYGRTAESAAEFTNILAAAQRKGSAEVIDMARSFLKSGPIAQSAQVPFIELISVLQALARAGILNSIAGTSLRTVMIRVARQAKENGDTFMSVLEGLAADLLSVDGSLLDVAKSADIFGVRQAHAATEIMKAIPLIREFKKELKGTNIALDTARTVLTSYEKEVNKIWAVWDKSLKDIFDEIKPALLELHRQWVAFITLLSGAPPGGLKAILGFFIRLTSSALQFLNTVLLIWEILTAPFALAKGWDAFLARLENIGQLWSLIKGETPRLESIMTREEMGGTAGKAGAAGRVQVDVNLRGNTEAVESARGTAEGDVDFNMGTNFAY